MANAQLDHSLSSSSIQAAQGYYELGMMGDCRNELKNLNSDERLRPDGLELEVLLHLDSKDFHGAIELCDTAIRLYPKAPFGYVNKAFALHELERTPESLQVLEQAHLIVSIEPVAVYNRGCYLACLKRTTESVFWINKALRLDPSLRAHAETDPDLADVIHRLEPVR